MKLSQISDSPYSQWTLLMPSSLEHQGHFMYLSCILVAYFPGSTAQVCELLEDKDQCYSYLCSPALSTPSTRLRALDIPEHSADTWYAELEKERSSLLVQAMSLGSQPARCLLGGLRDSTGGRGGRK